MQLKESEMEVFKGKTLGGVLEDIYSESGRKKTEIMAIIKEFSKMVTTPSDAVNMGPIITNLLEVSIRNDDQLVKVATIAQRIIAASYRSSSSAEDGPAGFLSEEERERLLQNAMVELEEALEEKDEVEEEVESAKEAIKATKSTKSKEG
jgi:hypothetical protein